jgi:outer membrane protein TolC
MKMMEIVYSALAACWDYYGAKERFKIRQESVDIAQKLLQMNKERVRLGKMAKSELMEAEAGLAKRKSWASSAGQNLVSAMNTIKSFISVSDGDVEVDLDLSDAVDGSEPEPNFDASMSNALELRPEYLSAKQKIQKEKLLISYAENQRWPQLDLSGSYGLNGLGGSAGDAWDDSIESDHPSWKIGLSLTIPLGGGTKSRSELTAAEYRKRQALLELKSIEVQVANIIDTAVRNVYATQEQMEHYRTAREIEERLLKIEVEKFRGGKSTSRYVLEKEDDLHYAKEAELESVVNNRKAIISLALAEGSVLARHQVDVEEEYAAEDELSSENSIEHNGGEAAGDP